MTEQEARVWNAAIDEAVSQYKNGVGAIKQLKIPHVVVVYHVGTTTKQDVVNLEKEA